MSSSYPILEALLITERKPELYIQKQTTAF